MRLIYKLFFLPFVMSLPIFAQWGGGSLTTGTVISGNQTGTQGDYHVEYWKDNGTGTMTLGDGCNFSCQWGQVNNILFRKGVRPGSKDQVIVYEAEFNPQGNSYLSIYGWFDNPLAEYYIIESWGSWRPPGVGSKGSFQSDGATYDIYQNSRTGPSIKGNTTFQQYWSVRQGKRTSGTITCSNHFKAWESKGMTIGSFYEVSFNVEAYQSPGGNANVKVEMTTAGKVAIGISKPGYDRSGTVIIPNSYTPATMYNVLGQKILGLSVKENGTGKHSVLLNRSGNASGVYFSISQGR